MFLYIYTYQIITPLIRAFNVLDGDFESGMVVRSSRPCGDHRLSHRPSHLLEGMVLISVKSANGKLKTP